MMDSDWLELPPVEHAEPRFSDNTEFFALPPYVAGVPAGATPTFTLPVALVAPAGPVAPPAAWAAVAAPAALAVPVAPASVVPAPAAPVAPGAPVQSPGPVAVAATVTPEYIFEQLHAYHGSRVGLASWVLLNVEGRVTIGKKDWSVVDYLTKERELKTGWLGPVLSIGERSRPVCAARVRFQGRVCQHMGALMDKSVLQAGVQEWCLYPGGKKGLDEYDEEIRKLNEGETAQAKKEGRPAMGISTELQEAGKARLIPIKSLAKWNGTKIEAMNVTLHPSKRGLHQSSKIPGHEVGGEVLEFLIGRDKVPKVAEARAVHTSPPNHTGHTPSLASSDEDSLAAASDGAVVVSKRTLEGDDIADVDQSTLPKRATINGPGPVSASGSRYELRPTPPLVIGTGPGEVDLKRLGDLIAIPPRMRYHHSVVELLASASHPECQDVWWHIMHWSDEDIERLGTDMDFFHFVGRCAFDKEPGKDGVYPLQKVSTTLLTLSAKFVEAKTTSSIKEARSIVKDAAQEFFASNLADIYSPHHDSKIAKRVDERLGAFSALRMLYLDVREVILYYGSQHNATCCMKSCGNGELCSCETESFSFRGCDCKNMGEESLKRLQILCAAMRLSIYNRVFLDDRAKDQWRAQFTAIRSVCPAIRPNLHDKSVDGLPVYFAPTLPAYYKREEPQLLKAFQEIAVGLPIFCNPDFYASLKSHAEPFLRAFYDALCDSVAMVEREFCPGVEYRPGTKLHRECSVPPK